MRNCFLLLTLFSVMCVSCVTEADAQSASVSLDESQVIPLYEGTAPGSQDSRKRTVDVLSNCCEHVPQNFGSIRVESA